MTRLRGISLVDEVDGHLTRVTADPAYDHDSGHDSVRWSRRGDHGDAMQVVGDEPNDSPERRPGASGGRGFEGGAASPLASPMCTHWVS